MLNKIKELRQGKSFTQAVLAEKVGVTQSAVAMWENGNGNPRTELLPKIAKVLECRIADLFTERETEEL